MLTSPVDIAEKMVTANGVSQHVYVAGPESGAAILLIHGLGWDAGRLWRSQIAALAAAGYRVLAPDLRGVGGSASLNEPYSITDYANDLLALLAVEGISSCAVVGFSLGGMIAMEMAGRRHTPVTAAAFCCCGTTSTDAGRAGTEAMLERAVAIGPQQFATEQADVIWHPDWAAAHPAEIASFKIWRAEMDQVGLAHAFRSSYGVDLAPSLPSLRMPTLVVCADRDSFARVADMQAMAVALPKSRFVLIQCCGHMAPIEQPAAFEETLLGFLIEEYPA